MCKKAESRRMNKSEQKEEAANADASRAVGVSSSRWPTDNGSTPRCNAVMANAKFWY